MAKKKAKKKEKKMAKKKPARKAAPRKRSASKKSARKRTAKRSASKPVLKARKPTRKAKRVASRTRPAAPGTAVAPATASVPFAVIPRICSIEPSSQRFLPFATVHFDCEADCWLVFSDPGLFGFPGSEVHMHRGDNPYPVRKLFGRTEFWIKDCAIKVGPADIIVP